MIDRIWRLGSAARFFLYALVLSGESLRRFHLTIREIYFTGVLSLIIIMFTQIYVNANCPDVTLASGQKVNAFTAVLAERALARAEALGCTVVPVEVYLKGSLVKVRVALANPGLELKPGMFAQVALQGAAQGEAVVVPAEAVMEIGNCRLQ